MNSGQFSAQGFPSVTNLLRMQSGIPEIVLNERLHLFDDNP
jgi:hypothetical protein